MVTSWSGFGPSRKHTCCNGTWLLSVISMAVSVQSLLRWQTCIFSILLHLSSVRIIPRPNEHVPTLPSIYRINTHCHTEFYAVSRNINLYWAFPTVSCPLSSFLSLNFPFLPHQKLVFPIGHCELQCVEPHHNDRNVPHDWKLGDVAHAHG